MRSLTYGQAADEVIRVIEGSGRTTNAVADYRLDVVLGLCYEKVADWGYVATATSDEFWQCVEANKRDR